MTSVSPNDVSPLIQAVHEGRVDLAKVLLDQGAAIDPPVAKEAVVCGEPECLALFAERGADLFAKTCGMFQSTLLHDVAFCTKNVCSIVTFLVGQGLDLEARNHNGDTPLSVACESWCICPELVQVLISLGANVNTVNKNGLTPLMKIATLGLSPLVQKLLQHGANVNVKSGIYGENVLLLVCRFVTATDTDIGLEIISLLLDNGAISSNCSLRNDTMVSILLKRQLYNWLDWLIANGFVADPEEIMLVNDCRSGKKKLEGTVQNKYIAF